MPGSSSDSSAAVSSAAVSMPACRPASTTWNTAACAPTLNQHPVCQPACRPTVRVSVPFSFFCSVVYSRSLPAPAPNNVNYTTLLHSWSERGTRPTVVAFFVGLMILFPIGVFAGEPPGVAGLNLHLSVGV